MHCREIRDRIDSQGGGSDGRGVDPELQRHLEACPDCREYARLSEALSSTLAAARTDDSASAKPLEQQRREVEARLKPVRPRSILARPAWRLAAPAVAVILVVVTFVPFTRYRTVGYDLNLHNVSLELAQNDEHICELLARLGLIEAGVDLKACDTTCSLAIFDLKTEGEARLVVGAIARLSETDLTSSIVPIRTKSSQSLLEQANDLLRRDPS